MWELIDGNVYEYYYDDGTSLRMNLMDDTKCHDLEESKNSSNENKWGKK